MDFKYWHPENAPYKILDTPSGMTYEASFFPAGYFTISVKSFEKRIPSTDVNFSCALSTMIASRDVQFAKSGRYLIDLGMFIDFRAVQLSKASLLMLVTDSGMVTDIRLVQLLNASQLIQVTDSGIVTDVSERQFKKVLSLMLVS